MSNVPKRRSRKTERPRHIVDLDESAREVAAALNTIGATPIRGV